MGGNKKYDINAKLNHINSIFFPNGSVIGIKMKKNGLLFIGMIAGILLTLSFIFIAPSRSSLAEAPNASHLPGKNNGTPTPSLAFAAGDDENPSGNSHPEGIAPFALTTPVPGDSLVYFVPSDNDASATVIYLYNTSSADKTVALRGYSYNGVLVYSLNIVVGATSFIRLTSDSLAAAPPPSWATPAPIITNFTDFTYFASLDLPQGVKAEGYTLFNPGTGVVDPRLDQGAIPLRFSTDPNSLFMPAVQRP
jgi:hypothetical protein